MFIRKKQEDAFCKIEFNDSYIIMKLKHLSIVPTKHNIELIRDYCQYNDCLRTRIECAVDEFVSSIINDLKTKDKLE